jgi:hypothetical protein
MDGRLGLPQDADEFVELVCDYWDKLGRIGLDDRKRRAFVTILERVVGAELQNIIDGSDPLKYRCAVRNNGWIK